MKKAKYIGSRQFKFFDMTIGKIYYVEQDCMFKTAYETIDDVGDRRVIPKIFFTAINEQKQVSLTVGDLV